MDENKLNKELSEANEFERPYKTHHAKAIQWTCPICNNKVITDETITRKRCKCNNWMILQLMPER